MEKKLVFLVILILLFPSILSECNSSQIDINSASESELTKINQVGDTYAGRIVDKRPFNSLEELKEVEGIAESRLEDIKNQGLACVENSSEKDKEGSDNEEKTDNETEEDDNKENNEEKKSYKVDSDDERNKDESPDQKKNRKPEVIKLSSPSGSKDSSEEEKSQDPKVIKNLNSFNFQKNKSKYANYGLVAVAFFVISSMLIKYRKNKYKNEFRE